MAQVNDKQRINQLEQILNEKHARVSYVKMGQKTTVCMITESDGWETIGVSHAKDIDKFDDLIGKRWALEEACSNLGKGRFWEVVDQV